jgi:beta-glucanase (GH16 family)
MTNLPHFMFLSVLLLWGCDPEGPSANAPKNLAYTIVASSQTAGLVDISVTADASNYYTLKLGQDPDAIFLNEPSGQFSHQFTTTGDYPVRIRAHSTFDIFAEVWDTIHVDLVHQTPLVPATGYTTPMSYPGYTLVWNDEFDSTALSDDWTFEIGNGNWGWGNNELEYYRAENTSLLEGSLLITAKEESVGAFSYTSSRLITRGKRSFKYGRVDIRAALPSGQGLWPALWMLGDNITTVGWPSCGEIDIMEMTGGSTPNQGDERIHGTGHWSSNGNHAYTGGSIVVPNGSSYQEEFHVFSIIWDANAIKWYRDDVLYYTLDITGSDKSEFHEPFYFIFNVAVGGNWPGSPNSQTTFPQRMAVDYIRVFQP